MAKPLVMFPDPIAVTLAALRGAFKATLPAGHTLGHTLGKRDKHTVPPSVVVADDGDAGTSRWPVSEDALMRITVWDNDKHRARDIAASARAHLLADGGSPVSRGFTGGTRPFVTNDPDDGSPVASFTIIARLRAE